MLHIHIGLSPLAQALILPVASQANLETVVIGSPESPVPPLDRDGRCTYKLTCEGPSLTTGYPVIGSYLKANSFDELPDELREKISKEDSLLLTASIRDRIEVRRDFVRDLLKARPADSETVVMACENKVPEAWAEIEREVGRNDVTFVDCMVNRIAVPAEKKNAPPGARATRTHPLGEWLVQDQGRKLEIVDALKQAKEFNVVVDLEPYKQRKLYLVNGGHLAVAIRGALTRKPSLRETARERKCVMEVTGLHGAMILGMSCVDTECPPRPYEYAMEQVEAYCEITDKVSRVMKTLERADLLPFLAVVEERLTEPALLTVKAFEALRQPRGARVWFEPYEKVFDRLEALLGRLNSYADKPARFPEQFLEKPDADRAALDAYARCLAWIPDESERLRRLRRVARRLGVQRGKLTGDDTPLTILRVGERRLATMSYEGRDRRKVAERRQSRVEVGA